MSITWISILSIYVTNIYRSNLLNIEDKVREEVKDENWKNFIIYKGLNSDLNDISYCVYSLSAESDEEPSILFHTFSDKSEEELLKDGKRVIAANENGRMHFLGGDGLAHFFVVCVFQFGRFDSQRVDFLNHVVVVFVRRVGGKASFLQVLDLPVDAPLLVVQFVEDREEGRGFCGREAGLAHDEAFEPLDKVLRRERSPATLLLGVERCATEGDEQAQEDDGFSFHEILLSLLG